MLVSHRKAGADTTQIFRIGAALAEPEPLTDRRPGVRDRELRADPRQLHRLRARQRRRRGGAAVSPRPREHGRRRCSPSPSRAPRHARAGCIDRASLLYLSVPLDRTARGGSRDEISADALADRPDAPQARRRLAELPGGGWVGRAACRWDDATCRADALHLGAAESEVWLLDLASGSARRSCRRRASRRRAYFAAVWKRDDSGFFVISDRAGEFRELMFYRLADGAATAHHAHASRGTSSSVSARRERPAGRRRRQRRGPRRAAPLRRRHLRASCRRRGCRTAASPTADFHPSPAAGSRSRSTSSAGAGARSPSLDPASGARAALDARRTRRRASTWRAFAEQTDRPLEELRRARDLGPAQHAAGALHRQAAGARRHPRRPRGPGRSSASSAATTTSSRSSASP